MEKPFVNNGAPELGHTTIKFDGPKANCCHNDGCIESFIGRKSFPEGPLEIYKMAMSGNQEAQKRFSDFGSYLGIAIANFTNIFNPDLVIIGGQLSNAYELFKGSMEEEMAKKVAFQNQGCKKQDERCWSCRAAILAF
jgi:predicted NBD/HSP70 family sugar kinase